MLVFLSDPSEDVLGANKNEIIPECVFFTSKKVSRLQNFPDARNFLSRRTPVNATI